MADHAGFHPSEVYLYTGRGGIPWNAVRVEVHPSVKFIPNDLCYDRRRLESVLLPDGLLRIGSYAFNGCYSLRSLRCPSSVTEIGERAFCGCSNLAVADLPEGLESIEASAFSDCTSLEELQIPASVVRIDDHAFVGCTTLASIGLREGLRMIGEGAFEGCRSLGSLRVPSSVVEIGEWAFADCSNLSSVQLREDLPTMKRGAFRGCPPESFRFARLSERMEAISMDYQTTCMFERRLSGIANAIAGRRYANPEEATAFWESCKKSLGRAQEVLTYVELKGAVPVLELALWKAKIESEGGDGTQGDLVHHDGGRLSREDCRVRCGAGIAFAEVLKFFAYSISWPGLDDFA